MPQSGEWFSPRTRPEMLTNEDPPVSGETTHDRLEILPGPATLRARIVAPARWAAAFVPALGRRLVRVDDEPSRWQLAGMWTAGSAIVAGTGLAVAAVLGGAPPALTQQFDRLSVLPGLNEHGGEDAPAPAADNAKHETSRRSSSSASSSGARDGTSTEGSSSTSYSGVPGVSAGSDLPAEVAQGAGVPPQSGVTAPQAGSPRPPAGGGGGTTAPGDPTVPPVGDPAPPVVDPTDPAPPVVDPTDPPPPVVDPTDPAPPVDPPTDPVPPPDTPTDPPPVETPTDPPVDNPPADDPPATDNPIDTPPADPPPAPIGTPTP